MRISSALIINPAQIKIVNHFKEKGALALGLAICLQFGVAGGAAALVGFFSQSELLYGFIFLSGACILFAAVSFLVFQRNENAIK